jgi:hypothetical protein
MSSSGRTLRQPVRFSNQQAQQMMGNNAYARVRNSNRTLKRRPASYIGNE